jgi:putative DNA primase/helicase
MKYSYDKVPTEIKHLKRWVLWKVRKLENGKLTKVPINALNGYGAKSNDESTWTTFEEAIKKVDFYNCSGVGFMLGNGYFGVDIDHAIDNKDLIQEFVETLKSYTERSQSGEGIHIICKGVLPVGNRRKGNIEMYDSARFFAMTGDVIGSYLIEERTEEVKELWNKYLNPQPNPNSYVYRREDTMPPKPNYVPSGRALSNDEVIQRAIESKNGALFNCLYYGQWEGIYQSQSEADMAFCSLLAFWCRKDASQMDEIFRQSKLYREKWDEKRGQKTYGEITIANACDKCRDVYEPMEVDKTKVYNPKTGEVSTKKDYDLTDTGNAQRFIDKFGENIRYNFDNKYWMIWDGKTWVRDAVQIVKNKADLMIEEMKEEIVAEPNEKYAQEMFKNVKHLSSNSGKEAMLKEAMHIGKTPVRNNDFDKSMFLLNCENGVVDLRTGKLLPHNRDYMMSKNTHIEIDLENDPVVWLKCIDDIFLKSKGLIDFIHKSVGYSLTGSTKEQCFFQCYGNGSNGKTVFINTVMNILGDYALNAQVDSILTRGKSRSGNASPDIARMAGARFVRTNEPEEGARFNEGLVKQLTGSDVITARFLYGRDFEFSPIFKLWILCNYKIVVRGTDKGIWRRMRLIPFEATFEGANADKSIEDKLKEELPQILGWAVKGCLRWLKEGLEMPVEVEQATKSYRQEMDIIESFLQDCVKIVPNGREKANDVFMAYKKWAQDGNEWCMSQSKFGTELGKKFEKKNIRGYVYYLGFILKANDTSYVYSAEDLI